jgi:Flp pilus assembly protein TadG
VCSRLARRLWAERAGTTAIEFAIIAPALLATLFAAFAAGWALHCNESVDFATQTSSRGLIANPAMTQSQLQTQIQSQLASIADSSNLVVTLAEDPTTASPRLAHVNVAYTHTLGAPLLSAIKYTYNVKSTVTLAP